MFDEDATAEDKNASETFVWRKKNAKIGLDKFNAEHILLMNKIKQEETQVKIYTFRMANLERFHIEYNAFLFE